MWKYVHTDDMYRGLVSDNNGLYHSDTYLGQDYSDGIRHYKYLKKIKTSSGKWRYIYDESELKKAQKEIDRLKGVRTKLSDKDGYLRYIDKDGNSVYKKDNITMTFYGNSKRTKADEYKEGLDNKIRKKETMHARQKVKDIPKRLISRGIGAVSKLLMNIEKNWVK